MKKWIAMLLAATMLLTGAAAFAAQGDALLGYGEEGDNIYFRCAFTDGNTLYLDSYDCLYTYHIGDNDIVRYDFQPAVEDEAEDVSVQRTPFAYKGQVYAIELYTRYTDHSDFVKAEVTPYTLSDGIIEAAGAGKQIDWSDMLQYYDNDVYPIEPQVMVVCGDRLFFSYYGDDGNRTWKAIDLEQMKVIDLDDFGDVQYATPYRDGKLLVELFNGAQNTVVRFAAYDPSDESLQPISEIQVEPYETFNGLAYDPATDKTYCVKGGEICPLDLQTGEVGDGVTDMPVDAFSEASACVIEGGYYAFASNGAVVRNLDPSQKAATRLKIYDGIWAQSINDAYYRFSNANGDVSVVISRDYSDGGNIIESMMNRDSGIDIYVLSAATPEYEAVHNRGYMMELDGSAKITAFADTLYPSVKEALSTNGRIVAIPVEAYCWSMGVNEKALEQMGMTLDDVPHNWTDFLDFLNELPGRIPENSGITAFYPENTVENLRTELFFQMFTDYQNYVNATDPAIGYNTERLRTLIAKLESVDFEALGFEHEETDDNRSMIRHISIDDDSQAKVLFEASTGCTFGNFYSEATPVLMSMDAQTPAYLALQTSVAFVNPFTKAPDKALAFMEELIDDLGYGVRYSTIPELNEPIRGAYNEKALLETKEELETLYKQRDAASAQDKQAIEETIRSWEESLDYLEREGWDVSQRAIDWYRANDDNVIVMPANWLYSSEGGEAYDLLLQYVQGVVSADEMLQGIDKKVQMMLLEGH